VSEKNNSNRFGIRTLELTIKVQKISIVVKMVINEVVHSIKFYYSEPLQKTPVGHAGNYSISFQYGIMSRERKLNYFLDQII
jgi:hypothetical protein